jgi:hypothetical protein
MLKIFSTQITGLLNVIQDKEEQQIEEGSRLLAQTVLSDGTVYFYGFDEMEAVVCEALLGENKFPNGKRFTEESWSELLSVDTVVVVTRYQHDKEALDFCRQIKEKTSCHVVFAAGYKKDEAPIDLHLIDCILDTKSVRGLIPQEDGSRIGFPSALCALFVYYSLYLTTAEILEEYED